MTQTMKIFIRGFRAVCKGRFITQPWAKFLYQFGRKVPPVFNEVKIVNHEIMNEVIEAIVNDAVERAMAFSPGDQSFIYSGGIGPPVGFIAYSVDDRVRAKRGGLRMSRNYARFTSS